MVNKPPVDLTGLRFARLVAIEPTDKRKNKSIVWRCLCDCGKYTETTSSALKTGNTRSCGCLMRETTSKLNFKHGLWGVKKKVYVAWNNIKGRCHNPNDKHFATYGAKGIFLQDKFLNDFKAFYECVGDPPENTRKWSIDRIDPNLGYFEGNMHWTTQDKQSRNTRKYSTNTSGVSGVYWTVTGAGNPRAVAGWIDLDGKPRTKSFLVSRYGEEEAFLMACKYREERIQEMNQQGAGYTQFHGK